MQRELSRVADLFAMIDRSRQNAEKAAKAGNYSSAAHIARELAAEAGSLADTFRRMAVTRKEAREKLEENVRQWAGFSL